MDSHGIDPAPPPSFKDLFCEAYECKPEQFRLKVLFRALYPHSIPFFIMLWPLRARAVKKAFSVIEEAATVRGVRELDALIAYSMPEAKMLGGFWVRKMRVRVSGKRLIALFKECRRLTGRKDPATPA
jgi:hypothetical protein